MDRLGTAAPTVGVEAFSQQTPCQESFIVVVLVLVLVIFVVGGGGCGGGGFVVVVGAHRYWTGESVIRPSTEGRLQLVNEPLLFCALYTLL